MSRKALFISLLLFIPIALHASVSVEPNLSFSVGAGFTKKPEDISRTSFTSIAELDPFCINIDEKHFISFPGSIQINSATPYYNYYRLNSHFDFGMGIGYRYRFNDLCSLKSKIDFDFRYVPEVRGGIYAMGITAEPWIHINDYLTVIFPLRVGFTKAEVNFTTAVGICYIPWGGR